MSNLKRHCCLRPEQHDGKRGHSCDNKSIQYPLTFDSYKYYYQFNHVTSSFLDKIYISLKRSPFLTVRCLRQFSLSETLFYCCCLMIVFQNAFIANKNSTQMWEKILNANREYAACQRARIILTYLIKPYLQIIQLMSNEI